MKAKSVIFSNEIRRISAKWWAQFLPGAKNIQSIEVNDKDHTNNLIHFKYIKTSDYTSNKYNLDVIQSVYKELGQKNIDIIQYNNFVKILADRLSKYKIINYPTPHISIDTNYVKYYIELQEIAQEIGINEFFIPAGTEMKIYHNNQFIINNENNEWLNLNSSLTKYTNENTDFNNSTHIILRGEKFRIIDLTKIKEDIYCTDGHDNLIKFENQSVDSNKLTLEINVQDFEGGEIRLKTLSDQDIINIIRDPAKIKSNFKNIAYLSYKNRDYKEIINVKFWHPRIDYLKVKILEDNYACYTSSVFKVIAAPQDGSYLDSFLGLEHVKLGDWLITRSNQNLFHCSKELCQSFGLKGYLCDSKGNILSQYPLLPGDNLPNMKFTSKINNEPRANKLSK